MSIHQLNRRSSSASSSVVLVGLETGPENSVSGGWAIITPSCMNNHFSTLFISFLHSTVVLRSWWCLLAKTPLQVWLLMYWMFKLPLFAKSDFFFSCVTCPPEKANMIRIFELQQVILDGFAADNRKGSVVATAHWRHTLTVFLQCCLSVWAPFCVPGCLIIQLCFPQRAKTLLNVFTCYLPHIIPILWD